MADADSTSTPKDPGSPPKNHAHVYDLLYQLNEAFARVQRRMALLEQIGIFDSDDADAQPAV